jgi:hypothetical protein
MDLQHDETEIGRVPQRVPWGRVPWREQDYDGSERPLDRDVEEQPRKPVRSDRTRRSRVVKTTVFWC